MDSKQDDLLTALLQKVDNATFFDIRDFNQGDGQELSIVQARGLVDELEFHNLVERISQSDAILKITPKGKKINEKGGYKVFIENIRSLHKEESNLAHISKQKLLNEAELSKLTLEEFPNTRRRSKWAFWLSIVAVLLTLLQLISPWIKTLID